MKRADKRGKRRRILSVLIILLMILVMLCVAAFYHGLVDRRYVIRSEKLHNETPIRMIVLSDLHSHIYGSDQSPLIERIARKQPDLICLVGDIPDDATPNLGMELLLEGIVDIAPCLYVVGNHEYWGDYETMFAIIERYNVPILRNETLQMTIKGQVLTFYGVDDPYYSRPWAFQPFFDNWASPTDGSYTVLLSHRPDPIETYATYGFDLVLSGHTHGGQVRIPWVVNGLYAPDQGWFPEFAGGRYQVGDTAMIVSRGLSFNPKLPRVFNPPEVVEVVLERAN